MNESLPLERIPVLQTITTAFVTPRLEMVHRIYKKTTFKDKSLNESQSYFNVTHLPENKDKMQANEPPPLTLHPLLLQISLPFQNVHEVEPKWSYHAILIRRWTKFRTRHYF